MSQAITLARPYARAAFQLAQAQGALPKWSGLLGFAAQVAAHPEVQALIGHPRVTAADLAKLVLPKGEVDPAFQRFVDVLAANRRLGLLPEIAGLYDQLRAEALLHHVEVAVPELERRRAASSNALAFCKFSRVAGCRSKGASETVTSESANGLAPATEKPLMVGKGTPCAAG